MSTFLAALPLLALGYLFASLFLLAARKAGYSHRLHTISEIGESGAPDQVFVAWGLFFPIGITFLLEAFLLRDTSPAISPLCACIAVGYLVAAVFPCDPGSPASGSNRQAVHNVGGAIEYIGGGFALLAAAANFGTPARLAGYVVLAVAGALTILPAGSSRGLAQRVGEIALFGSASWLIWLSANDR